MNDLSLWLTVLVAALISLIAIYYAVSPLLQPGQATLLVEDDKMVELLGRKDATLQAIKDLEFDYRVGKIDQTDFRRLDQRLRRQAIGLIQQIERLAPETASLDEELERIIAQFRQPAASSENAADDDEAAPEDRTEAPVAQTTRYCTECGKPLEAGHKFCAYCGTPVLQHEPSMNDAP